MFLNCNLSANGGINIYSEDPDNPLNTAQIVKNEICYKQYQKNSKYVKT